jgi:CRP-like cAMP-binding protein
MAHGTEQHVKKFSQGEIIVQEGNPGNEMYIVTAGDVGVYKNYGEPNELFVATLEKGNFFGEMSLFLNQDRTATVVALTDVTSLVVVQKNALDVFVGQIDIVYSMLGELCRRVDNLNNNYIEVHNKLCELAVKTPPSKGSSLFPPKHGGYTLPGCGNTSDCLYTDARVCPVCGTSFTHLTVMGSRLRRSGTDRDMRVRYENVEPMHSYVVSCPHCLYSAPMPQFSSASRRSLTAINKELAAYRAEVDIKTGNDRDTFTVFAGYYLALICAPICFDEPQKITADLWRKLSYLYTDCGDNEMSLYAAGMALQEYEHVYQYFRTSDQQTQQVCYILGDLYEKLGRYEDAREFFFKTKAAPGGTPVMKFEADKRLEEVRETIKNKK